VQSGVIARAAGHGVAHLPPVGHPVSSDEQRSEKLFLSRQTPVEELANAAPKIPSVPARQSEQRNKNHFHWALSSKKVLRRSFKLQKLEYCPTNLSDDASVHQVFTNAETRSFVHFCNLSKEFKEFAEFERNMEDQMDSSPHSRTGTRSKTAPEDVSSLSYT